jgi:hypothetical protein
VIPTGSQVTETKRLDKRRVAIRGWCHLYVLCACVKTYQRPTMTATDEGTLISLGRRGTWSSFPSLLGVPAIISVRSYRVRLTGEPRTAASCGGEGIHSSGGRGGARSDIEDALEGVVAMPSRGLRRHHPRSCRCIGRARFSPPLGGTAPPPRSFSLTFKVVQHAVEAVGL